MEGFIDEIENKYPHLKLQKQDTNEVGLTALSDYQNLLLNM